MTITTMDEVVSCVVLLMLVLFGVACVVANLHNRLRRIENSVMWLRIVSSTEPKSGTVSSNYTETKL